MNSYQNIKNCFLIINSNNQDLIHHIHCLGYVFYHQSKTKKFCWFPKFLFYDLYFEFYSLNAPNMSYSTKRLCIHYAIKNEYILLQSNKFFNSDTTCFIFDLANTNFFLVIVLFWLRWIIAIIKHFFILAKIFTDIFSFNFIHETISISE